MGNPLEDTKDWPGVFVSVRVHGKGFDIDEGGYQIRCKTADDLVFAVGQDLEKLTGEVVEKLEQALAGFGAVREGAPNG